jgi:hypothetical protein
MAGTLRTRQFASSGGSLVKRAAGLEVFASWPIVPVQASDFSELASARRAPETRCFRRS